MTVLSAVAAVKAYCTVNVITSRIYLSWEVTDGQVVREGVSVT